MATSMGRIETLLGTKVVKAHSIPPSTTVVTRVKLVACRRLWDKYRESGRHVTRRSVNWKLLNFVFEPLHARFDFSLEGCANDEGLNSHGDLPQRSPSDSLLERDLSGDVCSSIHHVSWRKKSVVISRVVGVQLQHLRWLCLFFLSRLSSTSSLDTPTPPRIPAGDTTVCSSVV
jgi:hypothetical protein